MTVKTMESSATTEWYNDW